MVSQLDTNKPTKIDVELYNKKVSYPIILHIALEIDSKRNIRGYYITITILCLRNSNTQFLQIKSLKFIYLS